MGGDKIRGRLDWTRRDNGIEDGLDYLENRQGVDFLRKDPEEGLTTSKIVMKDWTS